MNLKALIEKKEKCQGDMELLISKAEVEERALNEEEVAEFDKLEKEIRAIDLTVEKAKKLRDIPPAQEAEKRSVEERAQEESKAFSQFVLNNIENRAQLTQGENGTIVPTSIAQKIIDKVKSQVPFFEYAEVVETKGKFSIPVYGEDSGNKINADYLDENTELADNVGKITTIDLNGYVVGALSLISKKLQDNTDINVTDFIVNKVAEALASKLKSEFTAGSTKIKGILEAKTTVTAAAQTAVTYDEIVKTKLSMPQEYREKAVWVMNPKTYLALLTLKDDTGRPYFKLGEPILGNKVIESEDMPEMAASAKAMAFADLSGYTIKGTKSIEINILREKFATKNMIGIIGIGEYDAAVSNEQKFVLLKMAE